MKVKILSNKKWTVHKLDKGTIIDVSRSKYNHYRYEYGDSTLLIPVEHCEIVEEDTLEQLSNYLRSFHNDVTLLVGEKNILKMRTYIFHGSLEACVKYIINFKNPETEYETYDLTDALRRYIAGY